MAPISGAPATDVSRQVRLNKFRRCDGFGRGLRQAVSHSPRRRGPVRGEGDSTRSITRHRARSPFQQLQRMTSTLPDWTEPCRMAAMRTGVAASRSVRALWASWRRAAFWRRRVRRFDLKYPCRASPLLGGVVLRKRKPRPEPVGERCSAGREWNSGARGAGGDGCAIRRHCDGGHDWLHGDGNY